MARERWKRLGMTTVILSAFSLLPSGQQDAHAAEEATLPTPAFVNQEVWADADGNHINAHGGGVIHSNGTYYWYGESRSPRAGGQWVASPGVAVYSSKDLYHWKNEGIAMRTVDDAASPITIGCNIERPKVVYNAKTKQFVMWFHLELKGKSYSAALAGLATSDTPTGPFKFVKAQRPNAGKWPVGYPEEKRTSLTPEDVKKIPKEDFRKNLVDGMYLRRDFAGGQMSRDMTLYVDDDGKGYLISSAEENYTLNIHGLTDDYLDFTGTWYRVSPGGHNEAPAVVKYNGKYHMLLSGCTGWDPNPARVLVADSMSGPWKNVGNPCRGINPANKLGPEKTWGGQSTCILPVEGKPGTFIAMFDVWKPKALTTSGHVWLPVKFEDDKMVIEWKDKWEINKLVAEK